MKYASKLTLWLFSNQSRKRLNQQELSSFNSHIFKGKRLLKIKPFNIYNFVNCLMMKTMLQV